MIVVLRGVGFAEWFRRENSVEIEVFDSVLTLKLFDFQCSVFLVSAILRYRYRVEKSRYGTLPDLRSVPFLPDLRSDFFLSGTLSL